MKDLRHSCPQVAETLAALGKAQQEECSSSDEADSEDADYVVPAAAAVIEDEDDDSMSAFEDAGSVGSGASHEEDWVMCVEEDVQSQIGRVYCAGCISSIGGAQAAPQQA